MFLAKYIKEVGMMTDYPKFNGGEFFDVNITTTDLFLSQYVNNDFNAVDVVVKYLAIENFYCKNTYGFELYRKMQTKRIGEDWTERFKNLIRSFENGMDMSSWIEVDINYSIHDGAHRLALALYNHYEDIHVRVFNVEAQRRTYNLEWFVTAGFTNEEVQLIQLKMMKLLSSSRKPYYCILWPPARNSYWQIVQQLGNVAHGVHITNCKFLDVPMEDFKKFIYSIYETDDIMQYKLDLKYQRMIESLEMDQYKPTKYQMLLVTFTIDNPDFRLKPITGLPQSRATMRMKKQIRGDFRNKITSYYYDIMMHVTDNQIQSLDVERIINEIMQTRSTL